MEDASSRANNFDSLYKSVSESVQKEQEVQSGQDPIHSEVEAVKEQLEQHKVYYMHGEERSRVGGSVGAREVG